MPFYCCPRWGIKSPLLSFTTLPVLFGRHWWSRAGHTHTHTHITIFHIHLAHHLLFIGSNILVIAYLWLERHHSQEAKRMNINLCVQQHGRARTRTHVLAVCVCSDFDFAWVHVWVNKKLPPFRLFLSGSWPILKNTVMSLDSLTIIVWNNSNPGSTVPIHRVLVDRNVLVPVPKCTSILHFIHVQR